MNDPDLTGLFLDYYKLTQPIYEHEWPVPIKCPTCQVSVCTLQDSDIDYYESASTLSHQKSRQAELENVKGNFAAIFKCVSTKCEESLIVVGTWGLEETNLKVDERPTPSPFEKVVTIEYLNPPLNLEGEFPRQTPQEVLSRVSEALRLLWVDPSAAGTRIRLAIEEMLATIGPSDRRLSLQGRIQGLPPEQFAVAEALMAIKWIGNYATHEGDLTHLNIFNALSILKHALNLMFPYDLERMQGMISDVNAQRGGKAVH